MDERERRIGANEVLFREVNARIEDLNESFGARPAEMTIVCECGDQRCLERLSVPLEVYERVREDPARFLVVPGHEIPDVESVVQEHDGFFVIEKDEGEPADLAARNEPER